jgi:ParB-like chromosome segregation protein Spo0J
MKIRFKAYDTILKLSDLKESPFQRNKHSQEQIEQLAKIMRVEGITHPIHVTLNTDRICFGHGRKMAALLNGWTEFPVVYEEFDDEDQEYRMVQSDNGIAMQAELDLSAIHLDLANMGPFDIDLLGIAGFVVEPADKYDEIKEKELDENLETSNRCPSCDYVW